MKCKCGREIKDPLFANGKCDFCNYPILTDIRNIGFEIKDLKARLSYCYEIIGKLCKIEKDRAIVTGDKIDINDVYFIKKYVYKMIKE